MHGWRIFAVKTANFHRVFVIRSVDCILFVIRYCVRVCVVYWNISTHDYCICIFAVCVCDLNVNKINC